MCTSHDTFRHQLKTSSWPSNPLSASSLEPQIRLWLTIVRVYKLYLLTYLLTYLHSLYVIYVDNAGERENIRRAIQK